MPWTVTWNDLSNAEKAARLYTRRERTKKQDNPVTCCLCLEPIIRWQKYRMHANQKERMAHSECVEKNFSGTPIKPKERPYRCKNPKQFTAEDMDRAFNEGYAKGRNDALSEVKELRPVNLPVDSFRQLRQTLSTKSTMGKF